MQTKTTCPYCGVGCGIIAERGDNGRVSIKGDPEHPANYGRLCSKGAALAETLDLDGRLLRPMIGDRGTDWDEALDAVAAGLHRVIAEHGPEAVAFYVSGQLLTEDYYVANKLMKGFIGSANIDTNSRLCMSSAVAGYKRAFGSDSVPCSYEDVETAELVVLVGSNTAWCHPVLYQRLAQAKERRPQMKVVVIDPRRTETCAIADLHLPLAPGSDAILFNGLLLHLDRCGKRNEAYLSSSTRGAGEALASARLSSPDIASVALQCGLDDSAVEQFYDWFAATDRVVTVYSQGVNQSSSGTDKSNAIINCHLLTGRIGLPGMGPFSVTGQPNAMGGREVGGLANQLAAHMDFTPDDIDRVARFWRAPGVARRPGLKAVDMFDAIERGAIKAVWIMATNPVVSLPDADRMRRALQNCPLVIVSDCIADTDTLRLAHIRLPALAWGEKEGSVTNSERRISRQRPFLPPPGEARADWWIIAQVAQRLGYGAQFAYAQPAEIFREHAALSGFENDGRRAFDIGAWGTIDAADYAALTPTQWPLPASMPPAALAPPCASPLPASMPPAALAHPCASPLPAVRVQRTKRLFGDGRFYTEDGCARLVAVTPRPCADPIAAGDGRRLTLNTGRVRDQWHTMTRSGRASRLMRHCAEPYVQIHPQDAARFDVEDGALARVASSLGHVVVRAKIDARQRPGSLFVPIHWNDVNASRARIDALIPAHTDPVSGQPESKHAAAMIEPYRPAWHGFLLSRRVLNVTAPYWVRARGKGLWSYELAGDALPADWARFAREMLCAAERGEWIEYFDVASQTYRAARLRNGQLESCLFVGRSPRLPSRQWLEQLFLHERLNENERLDVLSGRVGYKGDADGGPTICACHNVGEATLYAAIHAQGLDSVEAIGTALKAGTHCGSCIPELNRLLEGQRQGRSDQVSKS